MTRKDIQILRGVSLVGVLFFHANNSRFQLGYLVDSDTFAKENVETVKKISSNAVGKISSCLRLG